MTPRWTYSEANAKRWQPVFDSLISAQLGETEIPLAANARSIYSLKVRVGDALKWLADQYSVENGEAYAGYADLKRRIRYSTSEAGLILRLRPLSGIAGDRTPLKLTPETLARLREMVNDPKYSEEERQRFAAVVEEGQQ